MPASSPGRSVGKNLALGTRGVRFKSRLRVTFFGHIIYHWCDINNSFISHRCDINNYSISHQCDIKIFSTSYLVLYNTEATSFVTKKGIMPRRHMSCIVCRKLLNIRKLVTLLIVHYSKYIHSNRKYSRQAYYDCSGYARLD